MTEVPHAADVLVIFGITGDLAELTTFHFFYRLEALDPGKVSRSKSHGALCRQTRWDGSSDPEP